MKVDRQSANRIDDLRRRIGDEELVYTATRSGGPGGQNVNKVATRVTLLFDLARSPSLTASEKSRLQSKLASRLSKGGQLRVVSSRYRTQLANRRAAAARLFELLAEALHTHRQRRPTTTPRYARERRLRDKQHRAAAKQARSQSHHDE